MNILIIILITLSFFCVVIASYQINTARKNMEYIEKLHHQRMMAQETPIHRCLFKGLHHSCQNPVFNGNATKKPKKGS